MFFVVNRSLNINKEFETREELEEFLREYNISLDKEGFIMEDYSSKKYFFIGNCSESF